MAIEQGSTDFSLVLHGWLIEDSAKEMVVLDLHGELHHLRKPDAGEKRPQTITDQDGDFIDLLLAFDRSVAWEFHAEDFLALSKKFLADGLPDNEELDGVHRAVRERFGLADHVVDAARYAHFADQSGQKLHAAELYGHARKALQEYTDSYISGWEEKQAIHVFVANRIASEARYQAIFCGHSGTSRKELQEMWKGIANIPHHQYRDAASAMADHYQSLLEEDRRWVEPDAEVLAKMTIAKKMDYWLYHLRDLDLGQWSDPGSCNVLSPSGFGVQKGEKSNPAIEIRKLGLEAVPYLIAHLDDARPTRCKGHWRSYWPEGHHLLRYQDAAVQILNVLLPTAFYSGSSAAYFSNESPEVREKTIRSIKIWNQNRVRKSELESK